MAARAPANKTGAHIENVQITNNSAANEHTSAAIVALAAAAGQNADALTAMANALKGGGIHMQTGIQISNVAAEQGVDHA